MLGSPSKLKPLSHLKTVKYPEIVKHLGNVKYLQTVEDVGILEYTMDNERIRRNRQTVVE